MVKLGVLLVLVVQLVALDAFAQSLDKEKPKDKLPIVGEVLPKELPKIEPKVENGSAFLIVCDAQPNKVLVLDSNGKWIPNVKGIELKLDIGAGSVVVSCTIYDGIVKPSKPQIRIFTVTQMKTTNAVEFQQLIDDLQSNPDAIKNFLKNG